MAALLSVKERDHQARESRKLPFCAGLLWRSEMAERSEGWLTEDEFRAGLKAKGGEDISEHQLERWRGEGVLPAVVQVPLKYHGSVTYYPPAYCDQAIAVRDLLEKKRKFEHVGWDLWWQGRSWVAEKHWKPHLQATAARLDRYLAKIRRRIKKDELSNARQTIFDRIAKSGQIQNIVLSRIYGRLERSHLATAYRVLLTTATGNFNGFESVTNRNLYPEYYNGEIPHAKDEIITFGAFDFEQSETDTIEEKRLNFRRTVETVLRDLAKVFRGQTLSEMIQNISDDEIARARDDVRNAIRTGLDFYEATKWIYGPKGFGLRLIAWMAGHFDKTLGAMLVVLFVGLRKISTEILPSETIAAMAIEAAKISEWSRQLKMLHDTDKRFEHVFSPKRLRKGLQGKISMKRLLREIEAARMR
jgi:hypothetical protein